MNRSGNNLWAFVELTRPLNVLLGALSVLLGAFVTGELEPLSDIILACLSAALIMAAGNVINDCCDVEIDRINKPLRPLPASRLHLASARALSIILFAFGIFLSIFINSASFAVAVFVASGLVFYSFYLKRTVLIGNIAVSLFTALAFLYGSLAAGRWQEALIPAGFAFFFHLGREIIKDVQDKDADLAENATTLPIRFGVKPALAVATGVFGFLIILTFLPSVFSIYRSIYLPVVLIGVDLVIIVVLYRMWTKPSPESLGLISQVLKADMFIGLLAIYLGIPKH